MVLMMLLVVEVVWRNRRRIGGGIALLVPLMLIPVPILDLGPFAAGAARYHIPTFGPVAL